MSTPGGENNFRTHLELGQGREVVFCHVCGREWYQDEHGLICPVCEGEITEIISEDSDPRPPPPPLQRPPTPPGFHALRGHDPWRGSGRDDDDSDPEEADIEEHISQGPGGHSVIFTRTVRSSTPLRSRNGRGTSPGADPDNVMSDFQGMIANLLGPQFQPGRTGRSGPGTMFGADNGGPHVTGARWTFTTTGGRAGPRDADGPQPGEPQVVDMANLFGGLFTPMGHGAHHGHDQPPLPPGLANLQGLFAAILNPANARAGDAVYTQEALDNIISQLMEQHPTSNAPGPASEAAIAALPKRKLDEKLLGPEGKGECSVCMDDVTIGDEVVSLPCNHWFHEQCASIWLKEHNTCPICRKGIDGEGTSSGNDTARNQQQGTNQSQNSQRRDSRGGRLNAVNRPTWITASSISRVEPFPMRDNDRTERNAQRLQALRSTGGRIETTGPIFRIQVVGDGHRHAIPDFSSGSGNFSARERRQRPVRMSRSESERHERERARPREERRHTERSGPSSRRDSRHLPPSSGRTNTSQGGGDTGLVGNALGWLRDRISGGNTSAARGDSHRRH